MIELAAIRFDLDGAVHDRFVTLVDPEVPLDPMVTAITGLSDQDLRGQPTAEMALRQFRAWLGEDRLLAAHNAGFDVNLLGWECDRAQLPIMRWRVVDTLHCAKALGTPGGLSLAAQREAYGWDDLHAHRAEPDAEAVLRLVLHAQRELPAQRFAAIAQGSRMRGRWRHPRSLPPAWADLPALIDAGERIHFVYTDRAGRRSERAVTPYGYAEVGGRLRFHGWCHLREERRNFAAERSALQALA